MWFRRKKANRMKLPKVSDGSADEGQVSQNPDAEEFGDGKTEEPVAAGAEVFDDGAEAAGNTRRLRTGIPIILWKRMDSGMAGSAMRMMMEP